MSKQVSQPRPLLLGALPERTGSRIREALPGTLRPGERMIGGRVFYSAAWLSLPARGQDAP